MSANIFKKHMPPLGVEVKVGADRKKLRRALEKAFPSLSEEDLDAVLPAKAGELVSVKLAAPRREVIYRLDGLPILLDTSNKMDLLPTVFALWKAPNMLPRVYVKHPAVTQFIVVRGADLMLPGVHLPPEGLPPFKKGDLLSVCVHGNPCPLAVGVAGMSSEEAGARSGGKLVEVMQAYGDCLWEALGGRQVPNDGFLANAVVPVGLGAAGLNTEGYEEDESGQPVHVASAQDAPAAGAATDQQDPQQQGDAQQQAVEAPAGEGQVAEEAGGAAGLAAAVEGLSVQGAAPAQGPLAPQDMDELLQMTLLQALHRTVKDALLPMTSSVLWSQHMQPSRPAGSTLDVKRSSHKKLSTFLKSYAGRNGLLSLKEDKHSGDQVVTSVARDHALYQAFRPYPLSQAAGAAGGAGDDGPAVNGSQGSAGGQPAGGLTSPSQGPQQAAGPLVVEELWKPGKELRPVFEALGQPHDQLYMAQELGDVAFAYVTHAQLTQGAPDARTITLDATLCDALFKGLVKKGELYPSHLPKSELREAFMRRCSAQCRISRGQEVVVKKGAPPTVDVSVEKRQGNKRVTRIVGVESFLVSPDALASECQRRFACSSTTNELPGKHQGYEVIIQGSVADNMAAFLQDKFSIPKKFIRVKS